MQYPKLSLWASEGQTKALGLGTQWPPVCICYTHELSRADLPDVPIPILLSFLLSWYLTSILVNKFPLHAGCNGRAHRQGSAYSCYTPAKGIQIQERGQSADHRGKGNIQSVLPEREENRIPFCGAHPFPPRGINTATGSCSSALR